MSRRATNGDSAHHKRVKEEKIQIKEERNKGKQRARVEDEEEEQISQDVEGDEDAAGEPDDEEEAGSPRGAKRMRVNRDGDSVPGGSQNEDEPPLPKVKTLPRGTDGYIPGSIVRIQLHNFVTYDYVQFFPGPYLNMIIGPNGTGKSSIACAIALGLNFPPAILGRAEELSSFVKHGAESGYIEIELKGPMGRKNLVIRRKLAALSNGSTFTLNGVAASGTEIKHKMAELNVQVGNLCSFLPQDRVSEFAAMSSQQLLRETQRAAGDENLTKWHDTLISAGKDLRQLQQKIKDEESSLKQMKERNEGIERDVQRFKDRKKIEHTIALLKVLIPVAEYRQVRDAYNAAKTRQRASHAKVQRLKERNAPAHDLLKTYEVKYKEAEAKRNSLKQATQAKFKSLKERNEASDKLEAQASKIMEDLETLKTKEKNRAKEIKDTEKDISRLEIEISKPPPPNLSTDEALNDEKRQVMLEKNALLARRAELDDDLKLLIDRRGKAVATSEEAQRNLRKQDNADVQKLNKLAGWDKDTHDAILWVRENRNLFKMEVFETPFMRLNVKDKRYTNAVEACLGSTQLRTFVTQCQEDCDVINHHINDNKTMGRRARITTWFRPEREELLVPPPMNPEEMQAMGFDGYALDYVDYPAGMKWFLMREVNLHRTAIALNGNRIDVNQAMQLVARPTDRHPGGATFINGNTMNNVTRSRYGRKAIGNVTRDVPSARNLTTPTIDPELKQSLEASIREAQEDISVCDAEKAEINKGLEACTAENKGLLKRFESIKTRRDAIANEAKRVSGAKARLDEKKKALKTLLSAPSAEVARAALKEQLINSAKRRMKLAREYTNLVHAIIAEQQDCTVFALKYIQIGANRLALQELCNRKDEKYENALSEYQKADAEFKSIKAKAKDALQMSKDAVDEAPDDVREEYQAIETERADWEEKEKEALLSGRPLEGPSPIDPRTLDELQAEMDTQRANLEMNLSTNPGVVEQYEKRKRDIEVLENTLAERQKKEERIARDIKNARDNWQPALETLVASIGVKFSAAFDRIGCAGEIRINENEDYEKWAIDILVKFRSSEKLQLLTAHRQSGGERSLTTILYLMSLTEEARAPFSLVDEINQGMDQRAERVVHNSMVNVTCQADSAQYFLITPKLLPDLKYDERMKILCVNNGEWLPEEKDIGRMSEMIDVFESRNRRSGGTHTM
ncbi:hypothetical protein M413DRAFT_449948 [Hebeloma cylindrosporum]|uniref:Structural maintenance of chromosomes protein 5 n=1 Tax=Hebeloma cylindrosporum TaxID=76867 RepID=A0A0C2Y1M5_HEBCY|nr:hypothetical protein M413DRAFT_449948 [Hebeloma cylindrosporum h7]